MHALQTVVKEIFRIGYCIRGNCTSEAVPSINYIGRQLDVSYIGRQMYGEISIYQIRI